MSETFASALRELRGTSTLSLRALSRRVYCSHGHVADIEAGRRQPSTQLAQALDDVLSAGGRLSRLARDLHVPGVFRVRSHKFIAGYVGHDSVILRSLARPQSEAIRIDDYAPLFERWETPVSHPRGSATLHVWAHGASVVHLVEEVEWEDITSLALWRYRTYGRDMTWAAEKLGCVPSQAYVLSLYWLLEPAWVGDKLQTALRLMCCPRALVGTEPQRRDTRIEEILLRDGLQDTEVTPFGTEGTSIGLASWSGVSYYSIDAARALREEDLVAVELVTQAVWQYCSWISAIVEEGRAPEVPDTFGWRWLRAAQCRLLNARPQESGPHKKMREAILATCGLAEALESAATSLREMG